MRIAPLAFLLVGCIAPTPEQIDGTNDDPSTDDGTPTDDGTDDGTGDQTDTTPPPPPPLVASGAFQVRSNIDLTVEALLPESAAQKVVTLRNFSNNPAKTMFDLAEELGVPAVQKIRDNLPSYVEDKLEGWINGEINKLMINGVPVPQVAGNIAALAETSLTQFALDSELTIEGDVATHTLKTIDLTPAGLDVRYTVEALPNDVISATAACSSESGELSLGEHGYAIQYGEYIWRGLNEAVTKQYGMDIRGTISAAVNCPSLADTISKKCYWGYCVGHKPELTEICEAGVTELVERAHEKFIAMRFDLVQFKAGSATLVDADSNGTVEALADGVWDAEINAGMGLRHVPATFTAMK